MIAFQGSASFRRTWASVALLCSGNLIAIGCGSGADGFSTAAVSGKVTRQGQPVSGGTVSFIPQTAANKDGHSGKPAAGVVSPDGTYQLTTYISNDGAIIGKHQVTYTPAPIEIDENQDPETAQPAVSPFDGLKPSNSEVEVKSGSNTINIELVPG